MSRNEQVNLDLIATDKASDTIEQVAESLETLERDDAEIVLRARIDQAKGELRALQADLKELTDRTPTIEPKVDASRAKRELDDLDGKVKATGERSVGAIRDLTGPLGEASSNVGDFGESFVALGETIGGTMGLSEQAIGRLVGFLAPAGIAAGAVFTFWNMYRSRAEAAERKVKDLIAAQEQLAGGSYRAAIEQISGDLAKYADELDRIGVTTEDVTRYVTGQADAIDGLRVDFETSADVTREATRLARELGIGYQDAFDLVSKLATPIRTMRDRWIDANGTLEESQRRQLEVAKGLGATKDALLTLARNALPSVRAEVLRYIAAQEGIPESKITKILTDLDPDDIAQVEAAIANAGRNLAPWKIKVEPSFTFQGRSYQYASDWIYAMTQAAGRSVVDASRQASRNGTSDRRVGVRTGPE